MSAAAEKFNLASTAIQELAQQRQDSGDAAGKDALISLAAQLELASPELQWCWGGPLNGQEGRRELFRALLQAIDFDAIFETGTYRGLTTAWLADHFSGPVFSCEYQRLYFLQAQQNLRTRPQVSLMHGDSRAFLTSALPDSGHRRCFVYLDAHWSEGLPLPEEVGALRSRDLPLQEEIRLIAASGCQAVIAIDDFQVPGDDYQFDDYGPGSKLSIEILAFLKDQGFRIYFPALPAAQETGAKRGVCVLTNAFVDELDACRLLVGGDWDAWNEKQQAHDAQMSNSSRNGVTMVDESQQEMVKMVEEALQRLDAATERHASSLQEMRELVFSQKAAGQQLVAEVQELNKAQELGRQLVEQRARVLQLERQNYILQEENEELRGRKDGALAGDSDGVHAQSHLQHIEALLEGLGRSRALKLLSVVTTGPQQDLDAIRRHLSDLHSRAR